MEKTLINRETIKAIAKASKTTREGLASVLGLSLTGLNYKLNGRGGRLISFSENEIQILRLMYGDIIFEPAPVSEKPRMGREGRQ